MSPDFPLLPDELHSARVIDVMIIASVVGFGIVVPAMQITLALVYFRKGHPWARLLK